MTDALEMLRRMAHRGACGCEENTGKSCRRPPPSRAARARSHCRRDPTHPLSHARTCRRRRRHPGRHPAPVLPRRSPEGVQHRAPVHGPLADPRAGRPARQRPRPCAQRLVRRLPTACRLLPQGDYAIGMVFLPREADKYEAAKTAISQVAKNQGHELLGWRSVPTNNRQAKQAPSLPQPAQRPQPADASRSVRDSGSARPHAASQRAGRLRAQDGAGD